MAEPKGQFNTVIFLLPFLAIACVIFTALVEGWFTFKLAGICLIPFVVVPHIVCFGVSVAQGNTPGGIVIFTFTGFWSTFTYGLFFLAREEINQILKVIEFPIFVVVFLCAFVFYRQVKPLFWILIGLGTTVFYLWIAKFTHALDFRLLPGLDHGKSNIVALLGVACLVVAVIQYRSSTATVEVPPEGQEQES